MQQHTAVIVTKLDDRPIPRLDLIKDSLKAAFSRETSRASSSISRVVDFDLCRVERILQVLAPALRPVVASSWCHGAVATEPDGCWFIGQLHLSFQLSHDCFALYLLGLDVQTLTGMALGATAGNKARMHHDGFIPAF